MINKMTGETYVPWTPLSDMPQRMNVSGLSDNERGLTVILHGETVPEKYVCIFFDAFLGYRNIDESYRVKTFSQRSMTFENTLYTVEGSSWISWFHEESMRIYGNRKIIHYSIVTEADCIDILSEFPPDVRWKNRPSVTGFQA